MAARAQLGRAWAAFWTLRKRRRESDGPAWAHWMIAAALAFALSFAVVLLAGLLRLGWFDPRWWRGVAIPLVVVGVTAGLTLLAVFRAFELAAAGATLERLRDGTGWRSSLVLNALAAAGLLLGGAIGMWLVGWLYAPHAWDALADPRRRIHLGLVVLVLVGANACAWWLRMRRLARRRQATEAQLHLLQAQIEPQFLFNTLADVQALLDHDPDGARRMLEEFTDYLRASLGQLRRADSTLSAELDMAESYLQLLRLRMGERLRFSIEASVEARAAIVPPLLLQPLVENAIKHGIGPKLEGGTVHIHADVRHDRLAIVVRDDGVGMGASAGAGLGLDNIRARLLVRHGSEAALTLADSKPGVRAALDLPFVGAAVDPSPAG